MTMFRYVMPGSLLLAAIPSMASTQPVTAQALRRDRAFKAAQAHLARDYDRIVAETVRITEIPAPPFKEAERASAVAAMMRKAGLRDVHIDEEGNAVGIRPGTGNQSMVAIGAHLDTVFPEGTLIKVRREGDRLLAPGISDNSVSVAVLLAFVRALDAGAVKTKQDLLFVANVGEEERGAFRGVRYLLQRSSYHSRISAFIGLEPGNTGGITNVGIGVRRYTVTYKGPGGHSMFAFGTVNPATAMAETIVCFDRYRPLDKTTVWNVGLVSGGTSINTIPASVSMSVDMRSTNAADLDRLDTFFRKAVADGTAAENAVRGGAKGTVAAKIETVLPIERPVTHIPDDAMLLRNAVSAIRSGGMQPSMRSGSSDSAIPQDMGLPGLTLDSGMEYVAPHSPAEAIVLDRPTNLRVMGNTLATLLLTANQ